MATRRPPAIGATGLALVVLGAVLVLFAFGTLDWYGIGIGTDSAPATTFANLRRSIDDFGGAAAAEVYFDWLSWLLLVLVIGFGAAANVESRLTDLARVLGFVFGLAGVGATYYALLQYSDAQADAGAERHNPLFNASWGLMFVILGFVLAAVGAVVGPRHQRRGAPTAPSTTPRPAPTPRPSPDPSATIDG